MKKTNRKITKIIIDSIEITCILATVLAWVVSCGSSNASNNVAPTSSIN